MKGATTYVKSGPKLANAIDMAQTEPAIVTSAAASDQDLESLTVLNGAIDLRTGALRPVDPSHLIRKRCAVAYDPDATAPKWEAFLARIIPESIWDPANERLRA